MTPSARRPFRLGPRSYDLTRTALVMGIVGPSTGSAGDGGASADALSARLRRAEALVADGADILDAGGAGNTTGGGGPMSEAEEVERLASTVEVLAARFGTPLAVETGRAAALAAACDAGAVLGRDVDGLGAPAWLAAAAGAGASVVVTHTDPDGDDLVADVAAWLRRHAARAEAAGLAAERIAVDVGLDVGKTAAQRSVLLRATDTLAALGYPLLLAPSGPFASELPDGPVASGRAASLAAVAFGVAHGCRIVRVHDVAGTVRVVRMVEQLLPG